MSRDEVPSPSATQAKSASAVPARSRRKPAMLLLAAIFVAAGIGWGVQWAVENRYHQETDDAYVAGDVVQITPQVSGTVVAIHVNDTDVVEAGYALVELDSTDARVALDQAEAALARTVREVRTLFATGASLDAVVTQREADLARVRDDLSRREALAGSGAISGEELQHARTAVNAAEAALTSAREQRASNHALIDNTTVDRHPNVAQAAARVEEAWLALQRTSISAPLAGQVARRSVQVGTRVEPGQPLMAVVPLKAVWVEANFKESQLHEMRAGQRALLVADVYGSRVTYHGRIVGLAAGTGSAFALLPAQNATGNWIKVVQRVPVRIELDPVELQAHPLRIGLSMKVDIDVRSADDNTAPLAAQRDPARADAGVVPEVAGARARIAAIITANLGDARRDHPAGNGAEQGSRGMAGAPLAVLR